MFSPFFSGFAECAHIVSQSAALSTYSSTAMFPGSGGSAGLDAMATKPTAGLQHHRLPGQGVSANSSASGYGAQQLSPLLDDTLAAVMQTNLGVGSSPVEYPPDCWTAAMSHQEPSTAVVGAAAKHHPSSNDAQLQQQQQLLHQTYPNLVAAGPSAAAAAAGADPNAVLYANYCSQHAQVYAEADRLSFASDMSTAAVAAAAQQRQDLLAAERAFKAQLHQQQLAYEAQQAMQQQQLLAHMQQQHRHQAAAAAAPAAAAGGSTSALYGSHHSNTSSMTQQHLAPSNFSHQQSSLYQPHNMLPSHTAATTAARLPPKPATTHSHHYHPYSTATGGPILEHHASADSSSSRHHHHNSLVAAAAAARAAALQQQQKQQRSTSAARQTACAAAAAAAAALQRSSTGRWSGAVAVLDQNYMAGSQESGNHGMEPCGLECDEDLQSMDGCDLNPHHAVHDGHASAASKSSAAAAPTATASDAIRAADSHHRAQQHQLLQGVAPRPSAMLSGGAAQHTAAAAAAAALRAAAAGYGLHHIEDDDQVFDMYEDSGSTHPDSDNQSDDMEADITPVQDQQRQGQLHSRASAAAAAAAAAGSSGGRTAAGAAASAAAEQAAAARQAVALRMLTRVASRRKGEEVLTAHPLVAEAAGAQSVRSRLLITEVSLYCDNAATSLKAMEQSNKLLAKMKLPDGIIYMPVQTDSFLFKAAHAWQFPAFVICLGSSYLQRMLVRLPSLQASVRSCPGFEDYCRYLPDTPNQVYRMLTGEDAVSTVSTLRSILFTCLYLATKVADQIHALGLLRFILTNLSYNGGVVSLEQAADIEARCLDVLDWRLGPFFLEDDLTDEELELWAGAMGHCDYGTAADAGLVRF